MEEVFFSIIVPIYNVEKYLPICLDSILQQRFTDYEIIAVDDGSTDRSGEIVDSYRVLYPDIFKTIHKENQGLISARRAGLKASSGKYICFLDSDDCWKENTLSILYDVITKNSCDVVFFRWNRIDSYGNILKSNSKWAFDTSGNIEKKKVFETILSTTILNSLCTKCCRRNLFDIDADYSQYYNLPNGEDLIQSLPVLYNADSFYYLDEALYLYRVNTSSITNTYRKGQHKSLNITRPILYRYIVKLGLDTNANLECFYCTYLKLLWMSIEGIFKGYTNQRERDTALRELFETEFSVKSKQYLKKVKLYTGQRMGLTVFFRGDFKRLDEYMKKYFTLSNCKRNIISCLSKIKHTFQNIVAM